MAGPAGVLDSARVLYRRSPLHAEDHDPPSPGNEQQRPTRGRESRAVCQGCVRGVDLHRAAERHAGNPADSDVNWLEGYWGLRHIEKTPADLCGIDSSRDFSVSFDGDPAAGLRTWPGCNSRATAGRQVQGLSLRRPVRTQSGFAIEGFYGHFDRPSGQDRETAQVFAGFRIPWARGGAQYLYHKRNSGAALPDIKIDMPPRSTGSIRRQKLTVRQHDSLTLRSGADGIDYR